MFKFIHKLSLPSYFLSNPLNSYLFLVCFFLKSFFHPAFKYIVFTKTTCVDESRTPGTIASFIKFFVLSATNSLITDLQINIKIK